MQIAAITSSGTEMAIARKGHVLLVIAPALQRALPFVRAVAKPLLEPRDKRVDDRGFPLVSQLLTRGSCRVELVLQHAFVSRSVIVRVPSSDASRAKRFRLRE